MPGRVVAIAVTAFEVSRSASSSRCSGRISVTFSATRRLAGLTATPCPFSFATSSRKACGSNTTPLPITASFDGRKTPEGNSASLYVSPLMTSVWPALWPPWKRTTMSACSDNQSTILPFPSSPHWAPTTTTLAISQSILPCNSRDLGIILRKGGPIFPDHALACPAEIMAGGHSHQGIPPDKGSGCPTQARTGFLGALGRLQALDIPGKFVASP